MYSEETEIAAKEGPKKGSRSTTFDCYKLIVCCWMLNEISIIMQPAEIAQSGWYVCAIFQVLGVIFIGIPLVYSEMCIGQYAKCNAVTMWDYFPLFRGVGYGTYYLVFLRAIFTLVLATWYLEFSFFSTLDPPPWYTCDDFKTEKCMVKRVNVSIFQHCLEMMSLHNIDCNMKTASSWFFEREIGNYTTQLHWPECIYNWKMNVTAALICFFLFILSLKNDKLTQLLVKILVIYVGISSLLIFWTALTANGTWYSSQKFKIIIDDFTFTNSCENFSQAVLGLGVGLGIILHFARETSFRSPANMNSIATSLTSLFMTLLYGGITFGSFKAMSFYHGEEENVIEEGQCEFFKVIPALTESLSYFEGQQIWTFFWFSSLFLSLFFNEWIMYLYLREILLDFRHFRKYSASMSFCFLVFLFSVSSIFFCNDLTAALADACRVIQLTSCLMFSLSLYWFYGLQTHSVDILFMIGVKSSLYWKIAWALNPVILAILLYALCFELYIDRFAISGTIDALSIPYDVFMFFILIGIYFLLVVVGMLREIWRYRGREVILHVFSATENWGPWDDVLLKSRKMFVPEIMTREFLYRQVRICGYGREEKIIKEKLESSSSESLFEKQEWNVYTSN